MKLEAEIAALKELLAAHGRSIETPVASDVDAGVASVNVQVELDALKQALGVTNAANTQWTDYVNGLIELAALKLERAAATEPAPGGVSGTEGEGEKTPFLRCS